MNTKYYIQRILKNMAQYEKLVGRLFHEAQPELERSFWDAVDNQRYSKLLYINEKINKLIDKECGLWNI